MVGSRGAWKAFLEGVIFLRCVPTSLAPPPNDDPVLEVDNV